MEKNGRPLVDAHAAGLVGGVAQAGMVVRVIAHCESPDVVP
jgi:hypothetical protein